LVLISVISKTCGVSIIGSPSGKNFELWLSMPENIIEEVAKLGGGLVDLLNIASADIECKSPHIENLLQTIATYRSSANQNIPPYQILESHEQDLEAIRKILIFSAITDHQTSIEFFVRSEFSRVLEAFRSNSRGNIYVTPPKIS
jgi:hypothetical protein